MGADHCYELRACTIPIKRFVLTSRSPGLSPLSVYPGALPENDGRPGRPLAFSTTGNWNVNNRTFYETKKRRIESASNQG